MDDMLMKKEGGRQNQIDFNETFSVLRKYNMNLNPNKCVFGIKLGKFLGFMAHQRKIEVNLDKIRTNMKMESPKNLK